MRNLSSNFATEQCRLVLRQWPLNPKEIEGKNRRFVQMMDQKEPVCASSFAKNGHEPLYPNQDGDVQK